MIYSGSEEESNLDNINETTEVFGSEENSIKKPSLTFEPLPAPTRDDLARNRLNFVGKSGDNYESKLLPNTNYWWSFIPEDEVNKINLEEVENKNRRLYTQEIVNSTKKNLETRGLTNLIDIPITRSIQSGIDSLAGGAAQFFGGAFDLVTRNTSENILTKWGTETSLMSSYMSNYVQREKGDTNRFDDITGVGSFFTWGLHTAAHMAPSFVPYLGWAGKGLSLAGKSLGLGSKLLKANVVGATIAENAAGYTANGVLARTTSLLSSGINPSKTIASINTAKEASKRMILMQRLGAQTPIAFNFAASAMGQSRQNLINSGMSTDEAYYKSFVSALPTAAFVYLPAFGQLNPSFLRFMGEAATMGGVNVLMMPIQAMLDNKLKLDEPREGETYFDYVLRKTNEGALESFSIGALFHTMTLPYRKFGPIAEMDRARKNIEKQLAEGSEEPPAQGPELPPVIGPQQYDPNGPGKKPPPPPIGGAERLPEVVAEEPSTLKPKDEGASIEDKNEQLPQKYKERADNIKEIDVFFGKLLKGTGEQSDSFDIIKDKIKMISETLVNIEKVGMSEGNNITEEGFIEKYGPISPDTNFKEVRALGKKFDVFYKNIFLLVSELDMAIDSIKKNGVNPESNEVISGQINKIVEAFKNIDVNRFVLEDGTEVVTSVELQDIMAKPLVDFFESLRDSNFRKSMPTADNITSLERVYVNSFDDKNNNTPTKVVIRLPDGTTETTNIIPSTKSLNEDGGSVVKTDDGRVIPTEFIENIPDKTKQDKFINELDKLKAIKNMQLEKIIKNPANKSDEKINSFINIEVNKINRAIRSLEAHKSLHYSFSMNNQTALRALFGEDFSPTVHGQQILIQFQQAYSDLSLLKQWMESSKGDGLLPLSEQLPSEYKKLLENIDVLDKEIIKKDGLNKNIYNKISEVYQLLGKGDPTKSYEVENTVNEIKKLYDDLKKDFEQPNNITDFTEVVDKLKQITNLQEFVTFIQSNIRKTEATIMGDTSAGSYNPKTYNRVGPYDVNPDFGKQSEYKIVQKNNFVMPDFIPSRTREANVDKYDNNQDGLKGPNKNEEAQQQAVGFDDREFKNNKLLAKEQRITDFDNINTRPSTWGHNRVNTAGHFTFLKLPVKLNGPEFEVYKGPLTRKEHIKRGLVGKFVKPQNVVYRWGVYGTDRGDLLVNFEHDTIAKARKALDVDAYMEKLEDIRESEKKQRVVRYAEKRYAEKTEIKDLRKMTALGDRYLENTVKQDVASTTQDLWSLEKGDDYVKETKILNGNAYDKAANPDYLVILGKDKTVMVSEPNQDGEVTITGLVKELIPRDTNPLEDIESQLTRNTILIREYDQDNLYYLRGLDYSGIKAVKLSGNPLIDSNLIRLEDSVNRINYFDSLVKNIEKPPDGYTRNKTRFKEALVRRNYYIVHEADAVFAVGKLQMEANKQYSVKPSGTEYGVEFALAFGKKVYFFDERWYESQKNGYFSPIKGEPPIKAEHNMYAGIGNRAFTKGGRKAIDKTMDRIIEARKGNVEGLILRSGGAKGADAEWVDAAIKRGIATEEQTLEYLIDKGKEIEYISDGLEYIWYDNDLNNKLKDIYQKKRDKQERILKNILTKNVINRFMTLDSASNVYARLGKEESFAKTFMNNQQIINETKQKNRVESKKESQFAAEADASRIINEIRPLLKAEITSLNNIIDAANKRLTKGDIIDEAFVINRVKSVEGIVSMFDKLLKKMPETEKVSVKQFREFMKEANLLRSKFDNSSEADAPIMKFIIDPELKGVPNNIDFGNELFGKIKNENRNFEELLDPNEGNSDSALDSNYKILTATKSKIEEIQKQLAVYEVLVRDTMKFTDTMTSRDDLNKLYDSLSDKKEKIIEFNIEPNKNRLVGNLTLNIINNAFPNAKSFGFDALSSTVVEVNGVSTYLKTGLIQPSNGRKLNKAGDVFRVGTRKYVVTGIEKLPDLNLDVVTDKEISSRLKFERTGFDLEKISKSAKDNMIKQLYFDENGKFKDNYELVTYKLVEGTSNKPVIGLDGKTTLADAGLGDNAYAADDILNISSILSEQKRILQGVQDGLLRTDSNSTIMNIKVPDSEGARVSNSAITRANQFSLQQSRTLRGKPATTSNISEPNSQSGSLPPSSMLTDPTAVTANQAKKNQQLGAEEDSLWRGSEEVSELQRMKNEKEYYDKLEFEEPQDPRWSSPEWEERAPRSQQSYDEEAAAEDALQDGPQPPDDLYDLSKLQRMKNEKEYFDKVEQESEDGPQYPDDFWEGSEEVSTKEVPPIITNQTAQVFNNGEPVNASLSSAEGPMGTSTPKDTNSKTPTTGNRRENRNTPPEPPKPPDEIDESGASDFFDNSKKRRKMLDEASDNKEKFTLWETFKNHWISDDSPLEKLVSKLETKLGEALPDNFNAFLQLSTANQKKNANINLSQAIFDAQIMKPLQTAFNQYVKTRPNISKKAAAADFMVHFDLFVELRSAEDLNNAYAEWLAAEPEMMQKLSPPRSKVQADAMLENMALKEPRLHQEFTLAHENLTNLLNSSLKQLVTAGILPLDTYTSLTTKYKTYAPLYAYEDSLNSPNFTKYSLYNERGGMGFAGLDIALKNRIGNSDKPRGEVLQHSLQMLKKRARAVAFAPAQNALYNFVKLGLKNNIFGKNFVAIVDPETMSTVDALVEGGMNYNDAKLLSEGFSSKLIRKTYVDKNGKLTVKEISVPPPADNIVPLQILDSQGVSKKIYLAFDTNNEIAMHMAKLYNGSLDSGWMPTGVVGKAYFKILKNWNALNTGYNPFFAFKNFTADYFDMLTNIANTPIAGKRWAITTQIPSAIKTVGKFNLLMKRLKEDGNQAAFDNAIKKDQLLSEYNEYYMNGGSHNFVEDNNLIINEITDNLSAKLRKGAGYQGGRQILEGIGNLVSIEMNSLENSIRFASYKEGRKSGMSLDQATLLGKDITANFDRKGLLARKINGVYSYTTANIAGQSRVFKSLTGKKGLAIIGSALLAGMAQQSFYDEMDGLESAAIPDYIKRQYIIIPTSDGSYIKIRIRGLGMLFQLGRNLGKLSNGDTDALTTTKDILNSFSFTGSGGGAEGVLQNLTPTLFKPLAATATNESWTGSKIRNEDPQGLIPKWMLARAGTNPVADNVARGLYEVTNGKLDWSPQDFEYAFKVYATGAVTQSVQLVKSLSEIGNETVYKPTSNPLISPLPFGTTDKTGGSAQLIYELDEKRRRSDSIIKKFEDAGDKVSAQRLIANARIPYNNKELIMLSRKRSNATEERNRFVRRSRINGTMNTPEFKEALDKFNRQQDAIIELQGKAFRKYGVIK